MKIRSIDHRVERLKIQILDGLKKKGILNDLQARVPNTPMYQGLNYGHGPSRLLMPVGSEGSIDSDNVLFFHY